MNIYDIIILTVIALITGGILFSIFRKKQGGCSSCCSGCQGCPGNKRNSITGEYRAK